MIAEAIRIATDSPKSDFRAGCVAQFIDLKNGWGLKFYMDEKVRDDTYRCQKMAFGHKLAPKLGKKIDFEYDGKTVYGYLTRTVRVVRAIFANERGIDYKDALWHKESESYQDDMKARPEYIELQEALEKIRIDTSDLHWANVGYDDDGNLLAIDFDSGGW